MTGNRTTASPKQPSSDMAAATVNPRDVMVLMRSDTAPTVYTARLKRIDQNTGKNPEIGYTHQTTLEEFEVETQIGPIVWQGKISDVQNLTLRQETMAEYNRRKSAPAEALTAE